MEGVDTHAHIFARGLRLAEARRYAPDYDVLAADYLRRLNENGLTHGVLVQPSFLGTDNGFMLEALRAHPNRLRGIAVVEPGIGEAALADLDRAGIVGIRLNLVGLPLPDLTAEPWSALIGRVAALGWQVELHREARDLSRLIDPLLEREVSVVVDHFGRPDPALGVEDPGFRSLLAAAASGRVWVKLSGTYRNGPDGRGERIAAEAVPLLREAFGADRLLWGSDWPHTQFERSIRYADTLDQMKVWFPDPGERRRVLVNAPATLFRF